MIVSILKKQCFTRLILSVVVAGLLPVCGIAKTIEFQDLVEERKESAEARAREFLKLDRFEDQELWNLLRGAATALMEGDFAVAEEGARQLTLEAPDTPQGWHILGLTLANLNRFDEAIEALDSASDRYERNADPLIVKGDILLAMGERDRARDAFVSATERDPDDWRGNDSLARMALEDGDREEAVAQYERAAMTAPRDLIEPRLRLAALYADDERMDDAAAVFEEFTTFNPDVPEGHVMLGRIAFAEGRNDEAAEHFEKAISLAPDDPRYGIFKARAELNAGAFEAARATLLAARDAFPALADVQLELAGLYGAFRNYAEARDAFLEGNRIWPEDPRFLFGAMQSNYRLGDFEAALPQAEALVARPDASGNSHLWHGLVLERLDEIEPAREAYQAAIAAEEGNWVALNNLAALLIASEPKRAVELANRAAALAPTNLAVHDTLAQAHLSAGSPGKAREILQELAEARPDDPTIAFRLGKALIAEGRDAEGYEQVERALALGSEFPDADEARATLKDGR